MSFAKVYGAQTCGIKAVIIDIEVDLSKGLHSFALVGLPDKAVEESRDRMSAAIKNSGFKAPKNKNQKVVVSLAPAEIKKEGPVFDLGIALSYLLATGDIAFDAQKKLFLGELSLDGDVRPVRGILAIAKLAKQKGFEELYAPKENAIEAALIDGITVYPVNSLSEIIKHINDKEKEKNHGAIAAQPKTEISYSKIQNVIDFTDIKGQDSAKRGLQIAASGGHNIVLYGPPGTGKTMLAKAFQNILPPLSFDDVLETTAIHSISGVLNNKLITRAPYRAPHHTASYVSIVGGGSFPRPGEITLAHRGVLFLDEFPEFDRRVIDALRQPLEDKIVSITRAKGSETFPADFILIAAMNPCPCGNYGSKKECVCSPVNLQRYQKKISGPIVDRIDMWIEVAHVEYKKLSEKKNDKETQSVSNLVIRARERQIKRFGKQKVNSAMNVKDIEALSLSKNVLELLNTSSKSLNLSPRSYHKVIKLARTIADVSGAEEITEEHVLEALQYRPRKLI